MTERRPRPDVDTALEIIREHSRLLPAETIPIADAGGRVVAAAPVAVLAVPRFRASAMDGFAIASAATAGASVERPVELAVEPAHRSAGDRADPLVHGAVARIATGAPVPPGADAVIPRERADARSGVLRLSQPVAPNWNVRAAGEDVATGAPLLAPGEVISPAALGLLAAAGAMCVAVRRSPRIRVIVTGSELAADEAALEHPARIPDSNGPMLTACLRELGLAAVRGEPVADDLEQISRAIGDQDVDLVLCSGGVSVGERDLVAAALRELGATIHFNGVAMRPGKPILFATLPDGRPFLGLPGNPVAALVGFRFFATALLRAMHGASPEMGMPLVAEIPRRPGTTLFLRGRAMHDAAGILGVVLAADQRSHVLSSAVSSDGWVRADADATRRPTLFGDRPRLGDPAGQVAAL